MLLTILVAAAIASTLIYFNLIKKKANTEEEEPLVEETILPEPVVYREEVMSTPIKEDIVKELQKELEESKPKAKTIKTKKSAPKKTTAKKVKNGK
jgi:hypothetical protein